MIKEGGLAKLGIFLGPWRGFCFDNADPEHLCRLRVRVPQVYGTSSPEYWALPKGIPTGQQAGLYWLPKKENTVWVEFENGDPEYPVWTYGWPRLQDKMEGVGRTEPDIYVLQSPGKYRFEVDETGKFLRWTHANGQVLDFHEQGLSAGKKGPATYRAVLGEKNREHLTTILQQLALHTHPTALGPSGPPANATAFSDLINKLGESLSEFLTIEK